MKTILTILLVVTSTVLHAAAKQVRVFVALCDNKTQRIVPVGAKIGNGDDPDANLYWGCTDGLGSFFKKSGRWKVVESKSDVSHTVVRSLKLRHADGSMELLAEAYRGSEIKQCLKDFESAAAGNQYDLVAYIGHNALMDFSLDPPKKTEGNDTEVIVLCCMSEAYFGDRLRGLGCKPLLTTQQLMYPGSFILHAVLESWSNGGKPADLVNAAAKAYARNQKISVKAAAGVFKPSQP